MAASEVLQYFREVEPRFRDVSDRDLIDFIGAERKDFLQDEDFKRVYQAQLREEQGETDLSTGLKAAQTADTALRSGVQGMAGVFASVPKAVAIGATAINRLRGDNTPIEELTTFQLGEVVKDLAQEIYPVDEDQRETWTAKIGQGLGSAAGFMAGGAALKSVEGIAALGSAAASTEFFEDAKQNGASDEDALKASLIGAGVGLTEVVPLTRVLNRALGGTTVGAKKALVDAALEGGEEAVQEMFQSTAQNITAAQIGYDPERGTFEGIGEAGVVGGATGVILSGMASALEVRFRGRSNTPLTDQALGSDAAVIPAVEPETALEEADRVTQERAPTEVVEQPTEVVEQPTEVVEQPTEVVEQPTEVVEQPTKVVESVRPVTPEETAFQEALTEYKAAHSESSAFESMLDDDSPESMRMHAANLNERVEVLEAKVADLRKKRNKVLEKGVEAEQEAIKTQDIGMVQSVDGKLEEDVRPDEDSIVSLGITEGPLLPGFEKQGNSLKFDPTKLAKWKTGKFILKVRRALVGSTVPTKFNDLRLRAGSKKASFMKLGAQYAKEVYRLVKKESKGDQARQTRLLALANAYLKGGKIDTGVLPLEILEEVKKARSLIDSLSSHYLDLSKVEGTLGKKISDNIGAYLTRAYKVHDPAFNWTYETVPAHIKKEASEFIQKQQEVDASKADEIMRDILDPTVSTEWILGRGGVGGVPMSNFIKRKDIPTPIRKLLGEIHDPVHNILKTTNTVASIVSAFELQEELASLGLEAGLFKTEKQGEFRFRVFEGNPKFNERMAAKRYPSLANLYTTKEMAQAMQQFYGGRANMEGALGTFFKTIGKITSIGKFSQVILNIQDSFSTNFLGAGWLEVANGRLYANGNLTGATMVGAATKLFRRNRGSFKAPSNKKIEGALEQTGQQFLDSYNDMLKDINLVESLTRRFGAIDENVIAKDAIRAWINDAEIENIKSFTKRGVTKEIPEFLKRRVSELSGMYAWPDNAFKMSAFMQEAVFYAKAYPDRSMSDIFKTAGDIVRATTPIYAKVPQGLKELNLVGVIPTYVSFTYEMFRNTYNSAVIGKEELKSDNQVIRQRGALRLAGLSIALSAAGLSAKLLLGGFLRWFSQEEDDERLSPQMEKDLEWLLAPWDKNQSNAITRYKHGKEFTYMNTSYLVPQAVITAPLVAAMKGEDANDAFGRASKAMLENFVGGAVVPTTAAQVFMNKNAGGGQIYNEQLSTQDQNKAALEYFAKNTVTPGIVRKFQRMAKASEDSAGSYGRIYSYLEETMRLFGFRPNTYNIPDASRFKMIEFNKDYQEASRIISNIKAKNLPPEEAAEQLKKEEAAQNRIKEKYGKFIDAMKRLGVSEEELRRNERDLFKVRGTGSRATSISGDLKDVSREKLY